MFQKKTITNLQLPPSLLERLLVRIQKAASSKTASEEEQALFQALAESLLGLLEGNCDAFMLERVHAESDLHNDNQIKNWQQDQLRVSDLAKGDAAQEYQEKTETALLSKPSQGAEEGVVRSGALAIYPRARIIYRDGKPVSLTAKEFDILYFLAQNQGEVFTKEQIYQAVWDGGYLLDDSNIMAFVRKIRKKIEPNPDDPVYIQTVWGIGYKFTEQPPAG